MSDEDLDEAADDDASVGSAEPEPEGRLGDRRPEFRELSERLREINDWSRRGRG